MVVVSTVFKMHELVNFLVCDGYFLAAVLQQDEKF